MSMESLRQAMRWWFAASDHRVKIVHVKEDRPSRTIPIEKWIYIKPKRRTRGLPMYSRARGANLPRREGRLLPKHGTQTGDCTSHSIEIKGPFIRLIYSVVVPEGRVSAAAAAIASSTPLITCP
uniref:Uncharacterized protein n=1 Tax=Bionectria ochroleuca TaxID=29856 RepID=A0A8H7K4Q9_BIOOC